MIILSVYTFLYNTGLIWLVLYYFIVIVYSRIFSGVMEILTEIVRIYILRPYRLSDNDIEKVIKDGNEVYVESQSDGLFIALREDTGSGVIRYLDSGDTLKYQCKNLFKDIIDLKKKHSVSVYDYDGYKEMVDNGFVIRSVNTNE
jgi:hypothetical protein